MSRSFDALPDYYRPSAAQDSYHQYIMRSAAKAGKHLPRVPELMGRGGKQSDVCWPNTHAPNGYDYGSVLFSAPGRKWAKRVAAKIRRRAGRQRIGELLRDHEEAECDSHAMWLKESMEWDAEDWYESWKEEELSEDYEADWHHESDYSYEDENFNDLPFAGKNECSGKSSHLDDTKNVEYVYSGQYDLHTGEPLYYRVIR